MHRYNIKPQQIEIIKTVHHDLNWRPNIKIKIAENFKDAIKDSETDNPDIKVFTDGSGMNGKIGAAAVLYRNGRMKAKLCLQLGSEQQHMVYEKLQAQYWEQSLSPKKGVQDQLYFTLTIML